MSSDSYIDALVKVLNGLSVPGNTTSEALVTTIGKIVEAKKSLFGGTNFLWKE